MLPFPKRTANSDEVELTDDDLVLVEETTPRVSSSSLGLGSLDSRGALAAAETHPSRSRVRAASPIARARDADLAATVNRVPRRSTLPPGSRRVLDEQVEEDVAGQCLASIAAATSVESARHLSSSSHIRAALAVPERPQARDAHVAAEPPMPAAPPSSVSRLPPVSAPAFARTSSHGIAVAPGMRDSSPPAAFVRRSSPVLAAAPVSVFPPAAPSSYGYGAPGAPGPNASGSVAPVSMSSLGQTPPEPTVIVVRDRPRSLWIVAAAAIGALGAIAAMRFAPAALTHEAQPPLATAQPAAALALPSPVVVAPVLAPAPALVTPPGSASAPSASASASPAVMRFGEDEGVAIKLPAPPAAAPRKPAATSTGAATPPRPAAPARPAAPSMGPALPDGSFGLGRNETTTAAAPAPPPSLTAGPSLGAAPEPPPRKRVLTPEQQLAEAQLKASMK